MTMTKTQTRTVSKSEVQDHIDINARRRSGRNTYWLPAVCSEKNEALQAALSERLGSTVSSGYMSEESGWILDEDEISSDCRYCDEED